MAPTQKGGNGRQKIAIRRIEKEGARQVCFSKRRQGLFIKATELAVMCGAEVAVVAFSPGGKAFSFGHPSAEAIIDRFLAGGGVGVLSAADDTKLKKLHLRHGELHTQLKEVKERKECVVEAMAKERAAGDQIAVWLNPDLGDMGEEEMKAFAAELMVVREAISERTNQVLLEVQNTRRMLQAPAPPLQQLFGGSTFEFGSSSSTNAGMEMQQMQMAMPPMQGFVAGMDMHHMLTLMPSPPGLDYGMDMQQIPMSIPLSSGFGAGMEKQQMVMAMSPMQGFTAGMDMQDMLMAMSPTSGLAYGMDMQQILMSTPSSSGYGAGMEMQQMQMAMSPQPEFAVGTEIQQMIMAMSPPAEFSAGMEMSPPMGIPSGTEMVQLGPGPNMGFP